MADMMKVATTSMNDVKERKIYEENNYFRISSSENRTIIAIDLHHRTQWGEGRLGRP